MSRLLQISAINVIAFYVSNFVVVGPMARFHVGDTKNLICNITKHGI